MVSEELGKERHASAHDAYIDLGDTSMISYE